jgi:hypothetical protein
MHHPEDKRHLCVECGGTVEQRHYVYLVANRQPIRCFGCRDEAANQVKHTIACGNKQAYELITNLDFLKQLNPKRTA